MKLIPHKPASLDIFDFKKSKIELMQQLEKCYTELLPEETFGDLNSLILKEIENGEINESVMLFKKTNFIISQNNSTIGDVIFVSCTYSHQAQQSYSQGKIEEAWYLLSQAFYYLGVCSGYPGENGYLSPKRRREIARSGGTGRAHKLSLVKTEALRILKIKTPETSWDKKNDAIAAIKDEVLAFIKNEGILGITESNIESWLSKNLPSAKELKAVCGKALEGKMSV
jgi:hypothetical protein